MYSTLCFYLPDLGSIVKDFKSWVC